jgi:hypothetical protein
MEELVNKLANLQTIRKEFEDRADSAVHQMGYDRNIHDLEMELSQQKELSDSIRRPFEDEMSKIDEGIEDISNQIVYAWDGSKKTIQYSDRILKFRTTGSLKIHDELYLFAELYDHIKLDVLIEKYLKGFNLTAVKKYMGVHELPIDVAEIEYKTTVKLEVKK